MAHLNIVSLPAHIDELRISNLFDSLDVFGFNETRLDETVSNGEIKIPGFEIIRKDRKRNGGGVCLYVRNSHNYRIRADLVPDDLEAVCIEIIKPNSKPFIVCSVYRPFITSPRDFFESFENFVKKLDDLAIEFHLLGDLNGNMLAEVPKQEAKILKRIYQNYQLSQLITKPTRITKSSKSLLDHYVTNAPEKIAKTDVIQTGMSDHGIIFGIRKINYVPPSKSKPKIIEMRNMKRFNEQQFVEDLGKQPWHLIALKPDTEAMWSCWKMLFLEVLDRHAPVQHKKLRRQSVPWLTSHIKSLIQTRDRNKRKAIVTNSVDDWENYKSMRNKVNIAIREAKSNYYRDKIAKEHGNPKEAWKVINNLLGRSSDQTVVNELKFNGVNIHTPDKIAENFNQYFSTIGANLAASIDSNDGEFEQYVKGSGSQFQSFKSVSGNEVLKLLSGLSKSKATGIDKVSGRMLKAAAPVISRSLSCIFNNSIKTCCFPDDWKIARVIPLFKKGERSLPENYRPISILPVISKIMEKIIFNQLYEYLMQNNLISKHQFGFRRLHSTMSALLDCTNSWYMNMDRKMFNLVVLLDLKKAFDTVNHEVLIRKMEILGISSDALSLLKSYLTGRKQVCQVNGSLSSESQISCGIPQGSILGPLFFILYINDLPECLQNSSSRMFADDTNLTISGVSMEEVESAMNDDLDRVKSWLKANRLSLNVAKTEFLLIGSNYKLNNLDKQPSIKIEASNIKQVSHSKMLGVSIDNHLSWAKHIDEISKKVSSGIGVLRRVRDFVDRETLISIYNALIRPHFGYCSEVWDNLGQGLSKRLQILQNRAARIILNWSNDSPHLEALAALGWVTLETQRVKTKSKTMFKVLKGQAPTCLTEHFKFKKEVTDINLRGSTSSLQLPLPKTEFMKRSFAYSGAKIWNDLPPGMRECESLNAFSKKIANHKYLFL